jgi:hypothetical protein
MTVRRIIVVLVALVIGVLVVRNAAVLAFAGSKPALAAKVWPSHPASEISAAMTEIALAARNRRPVPSSVFDKMADAATKEPLAPEPFLVRGVQAELAGDGATAQKAFEAAQWRDPRSLAAAYFLADRYFRTGDVERGLREVAALARLAPNGEAVVGPYLAGYAANPANWPALRRLFRANPMLADRTFVTLASNVTTVPALLALADPRETTKNALWLPPLLNTLIGAGKYAEARAIWAKITRARLQPGQYLYDASFSDRTSSPPFNWSLTSSTVGLAERQPGGRLHVVYYGQEDGFLASELLLLPAGPYRLSLQLLGDAARAHSLNWSIWCDKSAEPIASITLDAAAARGWRFEVPANCQAQWLKLSGTSGDISQQADVTVAGLKLEKAGPNG